MPSGRLRGLAALFGLIVFAAGVAWFGIVKPQRQGGAPPAPAAALPPGDSTPPQAGPEQTANISQQGPSGRSEPLDPAGDQTRAAAPTSPEQAKAAAPAEAPKPGGPSFDVVRVEPGGESVIAGRGAPGATIEMLRNGKSHA